MKHKLTSICICLILVVICYKANSQCYATRNGNTFSIGGADFRFIGVNLRATHLYLDLAGTIPTPNSEIIYQLTQANNMGVKVIRVFGCHYHLNNQQNGDRLQNLLNLMNSVNPDMKVIVTLTDFYNASGLYPDYANHNNGSWLQPSWFTSGYQSTYKTWVQYIVSRFASTSQIFAWEIGNELQAGNATDILNFAYDMGYTIKAAGANQMISTGIIGINHASNGGYNSNILNQLYNGPWGSYAKSPFSFGSVHCYNNEQEGTSSNSCNLNNPQKQFYDINWFMSSNYPYIVGEAGFNGATGSCPLPNFSSNNCTWDGVPIPDAGSNRLGATKATCDHFLT